MGFLDKVINEANDSHSNHPFDDPNHGIIFKNWSIGIYMKFSPSQAQEEPKPSG